MPVATGGPRSASAKRGAVANDDGGPAGGSFGGSFGGGKGGRTERPGAALASSTGSGMGSLRGIASTVTRIVEVEPPVVSVPPVIHVRRRILRLGCLRESGFGDRDQEMEKGWKQREKERERERGRHSQ